MSTPAWRMAKSLEVLRKEINAAAPERSKVSDGGIGDARHAAGASDHNPCRCCRVVTARDFTHDPSGGFDATAFTTWLQARLLDPVSPERRVKYVIWNRRIMSGLGQSHAVGVWRPYTGTNPHTKHVHLSVRHDAPRYDAVDPWGWTNA